MASIVLTGSRNPHKRIVYAGFSCLKVVIKILGLTATAAVNPVFSDFETLLECFAGRFLILIEGVGVNVQRGGGLGVAKQTGNGSYVRAVGNQEAGVTCLTTGPLLAALLGGGLLGAALGMVMRVGSSTGGWMWSTW